MFRREFVNFFYQHLRRDAAGRYVIELPNDRCYVEVEDTAYFVKAVYPQRDGDGVVNNFRIYLCDDTLEDLNPETLYIGAENILYCQVRGGTFPARFTRAAYYQLAMHIEYDEARNVFHLPVNGRTFPLDVGS